ncbi:MAG: hypothetical protein JWM81_127 [Candidatus Saccharibacteria bacterium]|nr:hypothetical protein [Candidatus Saccharibacteria bacterium]
MFKKKQKQPVGRQRLERTNNVASFSYYNRRSEQLNPAAGRQSVNKEAATSVSRHRKRLSRKRLLVTSGVVIAVLLGLYGTSLTTSPKLVIEDAAHATSVIQNPNDYTAAAQKILASSILNQNKVTVATASIGSSLQRQFPELASARLVLPFFGRTPVLYVEASQPVLLLATPSGSFALDRSGTALATGARLAQLSKLNLPLITDESGIKVTLHKQALSTGNVSFIRNVITQLNAKGLTVNTLTLPAGTSQLSVRISGQPYLIKFNLQSNTAAQQAGTFLALRERLESQGITPGEYVDVRVDGRAYYK